MTRRNSGKDHGQHQSPSLNAVLPVLQFNTSGYHRNAVMKQLMGWPTPRRFLRWRKAETVKTPSAPAPATETTLGLRPAVSV